MTTARRLSSFLILYHSALSRYVDANDEINQCHASVDTIDNDNPPTCNNYSWNWDVDAKHRCNIKKMSFNELYSVFESGLPPLYHEPVILYNEHPNVEDSSHCLASKFKEMMSFENITKTFSKDFEVTLSSSNSFSAHRRTTTLDEYINESMTKEILPHQLSNMTWYLFGETYSVDWKNVLKHYCLPPCQTCTTELSALSFGIGGKGSGVQWHVHGPGFAEAIHGKKHWVLYPPHQRPTYDPDFTSRHWMEEIYTSLNPSELPFECTLLPGQMIYFPDGWHHATINLSWYTAFISTFTTEHGFHYNQ